jgi:hypothetical protein
MNNLPVCKLVRDTISNTEVQAIQSDFSVKEKCSYFFKTRIKMNNMLVFKLLRDIIPNTEVQAIRSDFSVKEKCSYFFKERSKV